MGHALHGLLSDVTYEFISGTSVARDFVELPSQLYEHWLETPEVLEAHARHAGTGEPMPRELMERLIAARNFDQGFATVEYLASALVDLDFHVGGGAGRPDGGEAATLERDRHAAGDRACGTPPHFQHVFAGRRLLGRLLLLHVVGGDGRRRASRAFRETGDVFDPADAGRLASTLRRRRRARRPISTRLPRPGCRASRRCSRSAG